MRFDHGRGPMVSTRAHLRARPRVRVCDSPALSQLVAAQSAGRDDSFALTTDGHFYFGGLRNERRHHLERGTTATGMRVSIARRGIVFLCRADDDSFIRMIRPAKIGRASQSLWLGQSVRRYLGV